MEHQIPSNISSRTRQLVSLAVGQSQESDSDIDSDDSYITDNRNIIYGDQDSESDSDHSSTDEETILDEDAHLRSLCSFEEPSTGKQHKIDSISTTQQSGMCSKSSDRGIPLNTEVSKRILRSTQQNLASRNLELNDEDNDYSDDSGDNTDPLSSGSTYLNGVDYHGKNNCFTWSSVPQRAKAQTAKHNVIRVRLSKLQGPALTLGKNPTPGEVWRLFFIDCMIDEIVKQTNVKLEKMRSKIINQDSSAYKATDKDEMNAVIGIVVLCCIFKSSRESVRSLFSPSVSGRSIFRAIMTEKRYAILLRALRFDDPLTRAEREKTDPAAAISNIFNMFISNCQKVYSPGAHLTVDDTLVPCRGRVRFLIYMPKKPAKYGIKIMGLADAHNSYLYNAYIYYGRGSDGDTLTANEKKLKISTQAVTRLAKCLYGSNRNITCDNWFVSLELADELLKNQMTLVGTMKRNKPQIPKEFQQNKEREIGSSLYGFTKNYTLLSYVPKRNKAVILLSSMHHSAYTDTMTGKPEMISFYNSTKSGIDTLDMKCSNYSANRRTRRWPLAIFYHMVAMTGSNAFTLYEFFEETKAMTRFDFMKSVALSLVYEYVNVRPQIPNLPQNLRNIISQVAEESSTARSVVTQWGRAANRSEQGSARNESIVPSDKLEKRKTCRYCPYQKRRKTAYKCVRCEEPTYLECSKKICDKCVVSSS